MIHDETNTEIRIEFLSTLQQCDNVWDLRHVSGAAWSMGTEVMVYLTLAFLMSQPVTSILIVVFFAFSTRTDSWHGNRKHLNIVNLNLSLDWPFILANFNWVDKNLIDKIIMFRKSETLCSSNNWWPWMHHPFSTIDGIYFTSKWGSGIFEI